MNRTFQCSNRATLIRAGERVPVWVQKDPAGRHVKAVRGIPQGWKYTPNTGGCVELQCDDVLVLEDTSWDRRGRAGRVTIGPKTRVYMAAEGSEYFLCGILEREGEGDAE